MYIIYYDVGGNLAAAVSLELVNYNEPQYQPKYQFLVYPSTDFIAFNHGSELYYSNDPCLSRDGVDRLKLSYMG